MENIKLKSIELSLSILDMSLILCSGVSSFCHLPVSAGRAEMGISHNFGRNGRNSPVDHVFVYLL